MPGCGSSADYLASGGDTQDDVPDWWPYAAEFPHWHVWRGVCGQFYARRLRTSPPIVVRGENAVDLPDKIRQAEGHRA